MWVENQNDFVEVLGSSRNEASEKKLTMLLNITVGYITVEAEKQPPMQKVLRMIKEAR